MSDVINIEAGDPFYDLISEQNLLPAHRYRLHNIDSGSRLFVIWNLGTPASGARGEILIPGERYDFFTPNPLAGNRRPWLRTDKSTCTFILVRDGFID